MSHLFPSEAWAQAYHQAVNANPLYKTAGKDWTHGKVALIVKADATIGIEHDMGILLDVNAGVCNGAQYLPGDAAREGAAFAVEGPYDNWKKLIVENLDPIKSLMQGKLKLTKGHLPTMIRYVESSKQLLSSAQTVATEFRR
jgi:putative sterol carrier protein